VAEGYKPRALLLVQVLVLALAQKLMASALDSWSVPPSMAPALAREKVKE